LNRAPRRTLVLTILFVVALLYAGGFLAFVMSLPHTPADAVRGDGIVVLTGGEERLDAAAALLEQGAGQRLLISGVHTNITKADLKSLVHGGARFDCCADLGYAALNTTGNAAEAAAWARSNGYHSLVIVTADYHMPRALNEFAAEMPGIRLLPFPVEEEDIDIREWWTDLHTLRVLHLEYAKYLRSLLLRVIGSPAGTHRVHRHAVHERNAIS
jgi:uncharacterized SAM-binding protein YcdF (DUF218 family)